MIILALDLGRKTGWALHQHGAITVGTQEFPLKRGESPGMVYLRFGGWLEEISKMSLHRIGLVCYEQVHHRGGTATELLVGLQTRLQEFCALHKIEIAGVHTGTLKKWATGNGAAKKEAMLARARELGHDVTNDDEADAVLLLRYQMEELGL